MKSKYTNLLVLSAQGSHYTLKKLIQPLSQRSYPTLTNYSNIYLPTYRLPTLYLLLDMLANDMKNQNRLENYIHLHSIVQNFCVDMANEPHTLNLLRKTYENFDLIMTELYHFDTFFALAARFKAPIVGISFQPLQPIYNWITSNPWSFSYVPHLYLS